MNSSPVEGRAETRAPVVSVIVPSYNVERYLDQALASIEAQTLRDIEVVCVNDGSTDATLDIARRHARADARVVVVDKPNGGYGSACNCGIERARGRWIAIVEPDDWIEPSMLADMVACADSHSGNFGEVDIVKTPYWRIVDPDTPRQRKLNCSYKGRIRPKAQPFTIADAGVEHLLIHHPSIWSALYRRDFLDEFGIRFKEIPGAGWADNPFLVETLCQARAIVYLDKAYYCYREETEEKTAAFAARNATIPFERWHDMVDVLERLGVADESVWRAQIRRGFTYLDYIGQGEDLNGDVAQGIMRRLFERMDPALVFAEPHIPPAWKKTFAEVRGIDMKTGGRISYAATLVAAGLYSLANIGPAETLRLVGNVAKRDKTASDVDAPPEAGPASVEAVAVTPETSISVVVPVYNAQDTLAECLDSLDAQGDAVLEIVCVDDGSTDGSLELLRARAATDGRLRIVSKDNGGPSSARNAGIRAAQGAYVVFLDADDALEPGACPRIVRELARRDCDVVVFGWSCVPAGDENRWLAQRMDVRDAFYPRFEPALLFGEMTNPYLRLAVRRSLLVEEGISFDEELFIGEDCAFLFSLFPKAGACALISDKLYRYRLPHEGSIMSEAADGSPEKCFHDLNMMISIFGNWHREGLLREMGPQLVHFYISLLLYTMLRQPEPLRSAYVSLTKQLWLAHFTPEELHAFDAFAHDRALIDVILDADDEGTLRIGDAELARVLLAWRTAEYGLGDFVRTAVDRLARLRTE